MAKILINDGMHQSGIDLLKERGHDVNTEKIPQDELPNRLPEYDAICVRSATKVRADLIDVCPDLKIIGRGGVGLDNIDVELAQSKGIKVLNTPAASSRSVAELAMAHMLSVARFLYKSNRNMPSDGDSEFKVLKKSFSKGLELESKTLGIIGFGRIGQEMAKIGLGMGMNIIVVDAIVKNVDLHMKVGGNEFVVHIDTILMPDLLSQSDFISLHIPFTGEAVLGASEFVQMKEGVILVNASRGGTVDESALLDALESGKINGAGLDVYDNEPTPRKDLLSHPNVSLTPHIGASTMEAQEKIGLELAEKVLAILE